MVKQEPRNSVRKMEKGCTLVEPVVASHVTEGRTKKIISKTKTRSSLAVPIPRVNRSKHLLEMPMALVHVGAKLQLEASHRPNRATFMRDALRDAILRHLQSAINDYWMVSEQYRGAQVHTLSHVTLFTAFTLLVRVVSIFVADNQQVRLSSLLRSYCTSIGTPSYFTSIITPPETDVGGLHWWRCAKP